MIGGFWSPYAARLGSLSLALAPVKDCEGLFRELGGMRPSATALNHLVETLGSAWDAVQETALDEIRQAEGVPEEAASVAVSIDGRHARDAQGESRAGVREMRRGRAGFREASSGTVSLYDADGRSLRTVCFGRMPESGKVSLKEDVLAEVSQILLLRPDLQLVFISDGAPDHWAWCEEAFPGAIQVFDLWHALQHLKEALDCAYGDGNGGGNAPLREVPRDTDGGSRRDRQGPPFVALPGRQAPAPEDHLPRARLLPKATASHEIRRGPRAELGRRQRPC